MIKTMQTESLLPKVNDCRNCHQDFCECLKAHMKEKRDKNVERTLAFLKKNNIEYIESKTSNVVNVNPDSDNILLSLKRKNNLFKVRFSGRNKWYTFSGQKFLDTFSKTMNKDKFVP